MVDKITKPINNLNQIDKINEIIDNYQPLLESGVNLKTINNESLLGAGNIDIQGGGTISVDQVYDGTSENAQSGVAINNAKFLRNTATGSNSLTIDGIASNKTNSINIGAQSTVNNNSVALGYYATASGLKSVALGLTANAFAQNSIQIGSGANSTENTLQVRSYTLLDTSTGLIPDERISSNIARSSDIPDVTDYVTNSSLSTTLQDYALISSIPTKTSELINDSSFITSADLPTNYVTTDTAQDISGRKTFLGEKAIYFKQVATSNKLGFTLYNPSNTELAALEYRPNTISGASLLALNCPQTTGGYVGFRYWGTPAVNIVAPKVATAGNYYIPINFTDGTNTVTATNVGTVNISSLLPDISTKQDTLVSGTNIKTINNTSLLGSGNIDIQGGVFIARYNTTSFDDILAAYNGGKNVILVRGDAIYALIRISDTYIEFCRIDNHTTTARILEFVGCDNQNVWTESLMSIANRDLSNLSATGQAVIDSKVSKSDVWYDGTSSTLYIGVAQ